MMARSDAARRVSAHVLLLSVCVLAATCSNPINPEAGLPLPKDPGTLTVRVFDDGAQPVANARVSVTQPNNIGGVFTVSGFTDAAGVRTFLGVPAGQRPVTVEPPSGYGPTDAGLVQNTEVIKGRTTIVTFTLVQLPR